MIETKRRENENLGKLINEVGVYKKIWDNKFFVLVAAQNKCGHQYKWCYVPHTKPQNPAS